MDSEAANREFFNREFFNSCSWSCGPRSGHENGRPRVAAALTGSQVGAIFRPGWPIIGPALRPRVDTNRVIILTSCSQLWYTFPQTDRPVRWPLSFGSGSRSALGLRDGGESD